MLHFQQTVQSPLSTIHQATHVITDHSCLSLAVNAIEIVNLFGIMFSLEQYTIFKYLQRYSYIISHYLNFKLFHKNTNYWTFKNSFTQL